MKEKLKGIFDIKTLQFGKVRKLIEAASTNAATAIAKAVEKYELSDDTIVIRKSVKNSTQRVKKDERVVVAKISTGGLDLSGEVILQSGVIRDYHNGICLYVHDYGQKYLPIGRCVHIDIKDGALVAATVFAKHTLADELYHLYADDITYEGVNMGPICRDWSVDYIPLKSVRPSGRGWKTALGKAIAERPDLKDRQEEIQSIVTSWLLLGYSAAPIGMNPEAKTILEGKSFKSNELKLDIEHIKDELIVIEPAKAETYNCECIECGYEMETDEHCRDIECPECGGEMRRAERPGPGQKTDASAIAPEDDAKEDVTKVTISEEKIDKPVDAENAPTETEKIDEPSEDNDGEIPAGGDVGEPVIEEVETPEGPEKEVKDEAGEVAPEPTPAPVFSQKMIEGRAKALEVKGKGIAEAMVYFNFTIPVFAPIEPGIALSIVDYLIAINLFDPDQEVTMLLNSPGGYVANSFAITDTMEYVQSKGTKIKTVGIGEVASSGLMIFMTGDERIISPKAQILSHRFWSGAEGSQAELQALAVEWKNVHERILDHYAKHSKYTDKESIEANLLKETDTWLTAKQAIKHGLADKILSEKFKFAEVQPVALEEDDTQTAQGKALDDVNLEVKVDIEDKDITGPQDTEDGISTKAEAPEYATLDELETVREELEVLKSELYKSIDPKPIEIEITKTPEPEITAEVIATTVAEQLSAIDIPALLGKHLKRALGKI